MRTPILVLTVTLSLLVSACGDDDGADVSDAPTTTLPDTVPPDTVPPDTVPPSDTVPPDTVPPETVPDTVPPSDDGPILGAGPYPVADLTITFTPTTDGDSTTYRVSCLGDTATLTGDPAPAGAETMCLALADTDVKTRIVEGEPGDRACTLQYGGPETATITGTYDGVAVDTAFHRTDGCGIGDWELLVGVLPAPT